MMKSLILLTLTASAVMGQQYSCQPGSYFKDDCNLCTCSLDGKFAACTDMKCPEIRTEKYCEPGQEFQIDECNSCTCSADGSSALCTLQFCAPVTKKLSAGKYCTPNSVFNLDSCNTCKCSADGTKATCTLADCPEDKPVISNLASQVCKPFSQFQDYCNTCSCAADGMSFACTRMLCDKDVWNKDGSVKVVAKSQKSKVCKPFSQFKDYCNTCSCAADGMSYACTRMLCDQDIWNKDGSLKVVAKTQKSQVCEPRTQFNDYCNICTCNEDGSSYACTRMLCDKNIWNKDGSLKVVAKSNNFVELERTCEPKSVFSPDSCNTCICNADGTKAVCTMKLCISNMNKAYEVENTEEWGPVYHQGDKCTPGKLFYSECNKCICGDSGNSAYCSYMMCPSMDH